MDSRRLRALGAPFGIARARLPGRASTFLLLAAGVAASVAALGLVAAGSLAAEARTLERTIAELPADERAVQAAFFGIPREGDYGDTLDPLATRALRDVAAAEPIRAMQYRLTQIGGSFVNLGALDDVGRWVKLESGRVPHGCTPARCEVVQLAGAGPIPSVAGIRLVRVGRGHLTSPLPFARLPGAEGTILGDSASLAQTPPFLVAERVAALSGLPELAAAYRSYVWTVPLHPEDVRPWTVDELGARAARARSALEVRSVFFDVVGPVEALDASAARASSTARRLLVVGGELGALLLAFVCAAAAGLRRDAEAARRRLVWAGARPAQTFLLAAAEAAAPALGGAVAGWALAWAAGAAVAEWAGLPARELLRHSLLTPRATLTAAAVALAATLLLLLAVRAPALRLRGRALGAADAAALVAALAVVLVLSRGELDPAQLAAGRGSALPLLLLPALVALAVCVVAARALPPMLRLVERVLRGRSAAARLAAVSLARAPGRAAALAAFLAVGAGLGLFAAAYAATLDRGIDDGARFAVPADAVVREELTPNGLVEPLEAAPLASYRRLAVGADPVLRLRGSVTRLSSRVTLLGLTPEGARGIDGWRGDFADDRLDALVESIAPEQAPRLRGIKLPPDAETLRVTAAVEGDDIVLRASVLTPGGRLRVVALGQTSGDEPAGLQGAIPVGARGGRLVGLELATDPRSQHSSALLDGTLRLGAIRADTTVLTDDYAGWIGTGRVRPQGRGRVRYIVDELAAARFRLRQPYEDEPVPVVASPALAAAAAADGTIAVRLPGATLLARVAATARRFPSLRGDFVVADLGRLSLALDPDRPGAATPNEIWLRDPDAAALARPPFDTLEVSLQREVELRMRDDPLTRATLLTLAGGAAVALLVSLLGLLLAIGADLRDDRRELAHLEAQGLEPAQIRRHVRLRAAVAAGYGIAAGLLLGAVLSLLVVDLVALTAAALEPEPPLLLVAAHPLVAAALAVWAGAALILGAAVTRGAPRAEAVEA